MPPSDEDRLQSAYQPMASWTCSSPSKFPLASSLCVCRSPLELKIAVSNAVGVPSIRPFMEGASIVSGIAVITQETTSLPEADVTDAWRQSRCQLTFERVYTTFTLRPLRIASISFVW